MPGAAIAALPVRHLPDAWSEERQGTLMEEGYPFHMPHQRQRAPSQVFEGQIADCVPMCDQIVSARHDGAFQDPLDALLRHSIGPDTNGDFALDWWPVRRLDL